MPPKSITTLQADGERHEVRSESLVWRDEKRARDVPVKIWRSDLAAPAPVVIVSHGIGEDRDSYEYLGRALAAAGFYAVHITHAGTDRAVLEKGYRHLYRAVKQRENWVNRTFDVSFILDQLERDERADVERAAVVGHSAGAFTAFSVAGLRVAGEERTLRDRRVKVIVPMSMPRLDGVVPAGGYDLVAIPVLNITGTCDASLIYRTLPRHRRVPFESTHASGHWLVTIAGVNHDSFSATEARQHDLIARLTISFLRAHLLGDGEARSWFEDAGHVELNGTGMTVERK
ncbi:MAG TPA: alpha/beta hydrolase [Thermoanaerobaculia bacterium]|nr:alpha/beta hydrolase [Thermoanaerobaculia bacterium]